MNHSVYLIRSVIAGLCVSFAITLNGQAIQDSGFFKNQLIDISIRMSIKEIKKTRNDSIYQPHLLSYQTAPGKSDSLVVQIKSRGNFRFNQCYYPPLWIKFYKKTANGTPFQGYKKMKLVLPCKSSAGNAEVIREYLCYKLFEQISPWAFKARLARINFIEPKNKADKRTELFGIFLEDVKETASRLGGQTKPSLKLHPHLLDDTSTARLYLFEYLISNTDWSTINQHNTKLIFLSPARYAAIPYDFDMSGLVNAPYAVVTEVPGESLDVKSVKDRVYMGFCLQQPIMEAVRMEFLGKQPQLMEIPRQYRDLLGDRDLRQTNRYLLEFFEILKNDKEFAMKILNRCRPLK